MKTNRPLRLYMVTLELITAYGEITKTTSAVEATNHRDAVIDAKHDHDDVYHVSLVSWRDCGVVQSESEVY
jgi:hypothetical protein